MSGLDFLLRMKDGGKLPGSDAAIDASAAREMASRALSQLSGKRIGLLANAASVTSAFVPAERALREAGFDVRVLFGPEHGFWGSAQDMEAVAGCATCSVP